MSHRQCPWCACPPPMWARAKWRGWWIWLHEDTAIYNDTWHVFHMSANTSGGEGDDRSASLPFPLSLSATGSDASSAALKWKKWIIHANYTPARTVCFSLRPGENKLSKSNESHSVGLIVYYSICVNQLANIAPFQEYSFSFSRGLLPQWGWSIRILPWQSRSVLMYFERDDMNIKAVLRSPNKYFSDAFWWAEKGSVGQFTEWFSVTRTLTKYSE